MLCLFVVRDDKPQGWVFRGVSCVLWMGHIGGEFLASGDCCGLTRIWNNLFNIFLTLEHHCLKKFHHHYCWVYFTWYKKPNRKPKRNTSHKIYWSGVIHGKVKNSSLTFSDARSHKMEKKCIICRSKRKGTKLVKNQAVKTKNSCNLLNTFFSSIYTFLEHVSLVQWSYEKISTFSIDENW